ncbi:MAG TPA: hypothetical protein P5514_12750 [Bacteroidales bacterium]|nr:hypothetical protein [Bacteroidales bacterium]HPE55042.1 hypothetical protein [Bacteroidales bacterium]HRX97808.1 hypothetical protein [Bacteroidales bacterium]
MEEQKKQGLTLFAKISIVINTLLFGITGVIYLANKNNVIGILLLAAGFTNVLYLLITVKTTNYFFVVLNFIFAIVALVVGINFLLSDSSEIGMVWMIITLYYVITGFIILMKVNKRKSLPPPSV